jgi:cytochrome c-type biogenesis protein CcmH
MRLRFALIFMLLMQPFALHAVQVDELLPNPVLEQRARALSVQLRCLVCQNQSIDDSDAPLARDLRLLVRERLVAGDSDEAVKAYLVNRYGAFILLQPPFKPETYLLWLFPVICLVLGGGVLLASRRSAQNVDSEPMSAEDEAALRHILEHTLPE